MSLSLEETDSPSLSSHWPLVYSFKKRKDLINFPLSLPACQLLSHRSCSENHIVENFPSHLKDTSYNQASWSAGSSRLLILFSKLPEP